MKYCKNCKAKHQDDAVFCDSCGLRFDDIVLDDNVLYQTTETSNLNQPIYTPPTPIEQPEQPVLPKRHFGGYTAWSILNICMVLFASFTLTTSICSMVMGIIGLKTTAKAKAENNEEYYAIYKKNVFILNLTASLITLAGIIAYAVLTLLQYYDGSLVL